MLFLKRIVALVVTVSTLVSGWVHAPAPQQPNTPPVVISQPVEPTKPPQTPSEPEPGQQQGNTQPGKATPPVVPPGETPSNQGTDKPDGQKPTPSRRRLAYLTFDDGPDARTTPQILDILKTHDVRATFFAVGSKAAAYPRMLRRIKEEGHAIGNHTYSHNYREIYTDVESFYWDLERANDIFERLTGERSLLIRAPGGSSRKFRTEFAPELEQYGYQYFDWNVDSRDALDRKQTAAEMTERILRQASKKREAVILMHNINTPVTVQALPGIIAGLRAMGFSFEVIKADTAPVHFTGN